MSLAYSGVEANVLAGADQQALIDVDTQGWSGDVEVSTFDSTTTADAGWEDITPATRKITGTFTFFYNPTKPPWGSTLNLFEGQIVYMQLFVNKTDNIMLSGMGLITKMSVKAEIKGGVVITASFQGKGPWVMPTQVVTPAGKMYKAA